MTSDLPPLSKTHPTLWNHPIHQHTMDDLIGLNDRSLWECLQSCTVDKAEHEGVKRLYCHYMAEVERLKKELEETKSTIVKHDTAMWDLALVEGERRATQRVKEAINKHVQWLEDNALLGNPDLQRSALYLIVGLSDKDDEQTPKEGAK